jgi:hypothetical protein
LREKIAEKFEKHRICAGKNAKEFEKHQSYAEKTRKSLKNIKFMGKKRERV